MKVTITLGQKALEYVTGIPEEELPEILSDVLERSLVSQVKPITEEEPIKKSSVDDDIISQLKAMLSTMNSPITTVNQTIRDDTPLTRKIDMKIEKIDSSSSTSDGEVDLDCFDFFK